MVYEGRSRGYARSGGARRNSGRGTPRRSAGGKLFSVCLWVLFIAVAVRVLAPETAKKWGDRAADLIGVHDLGGAVEVFGQEMESGSGIVGAFKGAWEYAFQPAAGDEIQASAGEEQGDVNASLEDGEDLPAIADMPSQPEDGEETDPVASFKASQAAFTQLGIPDHVTYERPETAANLQNPLAGTVTSGFGYRKHPSDGKVRFHYGVDIGAAEGTEVLAAAAGEVAAVGDSTSYGLYVILRHQGGVETLYAHMGEVKVSGGETLEAGQCVGLVGTTGNATAPCLHLEMLVDGDYVNPEYYLEF